jgi:putative transposase
MREARPSADLPSWGAIDRYVKNKIRPDIAILAREGKREYDRVAMPRIIRDTARMLANDWSIGDGRVHDVEVYNTVFPSNILELRKMYRPWMSLTWDWASRKITGVVWAPTPSSRTITASLRMAVSQFGLPRNFYWDNGKDYRKVGRVMMADDLAAILRANSVEITHALPYNPMSKAIEPFFQNMAYGFDQKCGVSYCGNDPKKCSGRHREAQREHKAFLEGKARTTPIKSDRDFIIAASQEIDEYNARGSDALDGRSPNEVFEEQAPPESRRMVDRRVLAQLFYERDKRVVKQGGCVELNNMRYEPSDDESFAALSAKWKRDVLIARDAWNLGVAAAFDIESGEFLGDLRIQKPVEQTPHGRLSVDGIRATARRKSALYRSAALYLASIDAMAEQNGWKSAFDSLLERADVAATGTDGRVQRSAPGAGILPPMAEPRRLTSGSPFISDAAKEDAAMFAEFARPKMENGE